MKTTAWIGAGLWLALNTACHTPPSTSPGPLRGAESASRPELRYYVIGDA